MPLSYQSLADYFGYSTAYDNRDGLGVEWEIHKSLDTMKRQHMLISDASGKIIGRQYLVDNLRETWTNSTCKTIGLASELFTATRGVISILPSSQIASHKLESTPEMES